MGLGHKPQPVDGDGKDPRMTAKQETGTGICSDSRGNHTLTF